MHNDREYRDHPFSTAGMRWSSSPKQRSLGTDGPPPPPPLPMVLGRSEGPRSAHPMSTSSGNYTQSRNEGINEGRPQPKTAFRVADIVGGVESKERVTNNSTSNMYEPPQRGYSYAPPTQERDWQPERVYVNRNVNSSLPMDGHNSSNVPYGRHSPLQRDYNGEAMGQSSSRVGGDRYNGDRGVQSSDGRVNQPPPRDRFVQPPPHPTRARYSSNEAVYSGRDNTGMRGTSYETSSVVRDRYPASGGVSMPRGRADFPEMGQTHSRQVDSRVSQFPMPGPARDRQTERYEQAPRQSFVSGRDVPGVPRDRMEESVAGGRDDKPDMGSGSTNKYMGSSSAGQDLQGHGGKYAYSSGHQRRGSEPNVGVYQSGMNGHSGMSRSYNTEAPPLPTPKYRGSNIMSPQVVYYSGDTNSSGTNNSHNNNNIGDTRTNNNKNRAGGLSNERLNRLDSRSDSHTNLNTSSRYEPYSSPRISSAKSTQAPLRSSYAAPSQTQKHASPVLHSSYPSQTSTSNLPKPSPQNSHQNTNGEFKWMNNGLPADGFSHPPNHRLPSSWHNGGSKSTNNNNNNDSNNNVSASNSLQRNRYNKPPALLPQGKRRPQSPSPMQMNHGTETVSPPHWAKFDSSSSLHDPMRSRRDPPSPFLPIGPQHTRALTPPTQRKDLPTSFSKPKRDVSPMQVYQRQTSSQSLMAHHAQPPILPNEFHTTNTNSNRAIKNSNRANNKSNRSNNDNHDDHLQPMQEDVSHDVYPLHSTHQMHHSQQRPQQQKAAQPPLLPLGKRESLSAGKPYQAKSAVKSEPKSGMPSSGIRVNFESKPQIKVEHSDNVRASFNNGDTQFVIPTPVSLPTSAPGSEKPFAPSRPSISQDLRGSAREFGSQVHMGDILTTSPSRKRQSHELLDRYAPSSATRSSHESDETINGMPLHAISHDAYDAREKEVKRKRRLSSKAVEFHERYTYSEDAPRLLTKKPTNYTKPRPHPGTLRSQISVPLPSPVKVDSPELVRIVEVDENMTDKEAEKRLGAKISKISLTGKQKKSESVLEVGCRVQVNKEGKQIGRVRFLDVTGAFVHYEGWGVEYDEWVDLELVKIVDMPVDDDTLGPNGTENDEKWQSIRENAKTMVGHYKTGIIFDATTMKHECTCDAPQSWHPEQPARIAWILGEMDKAHLIDRCLPLRSREVLIEELDLVHSSKHIQTYGLVPVGTKLEPMELEEMECGGAGVACDTVYNKDTSPLSAFLAAGCLLEIVQKVIKGDLENGFAVIRPPGHHAEAKEALGFCFFNNVSVCAAVATQRWGVKKILIVDWDVHHGNGTQNIFYDKKNVMYMSLHRHDEGKFYPFTGGPDECGDDDGEGYNINIAWKGQAKVGNIEYINAFKHIVMPIARQFNPELVIVSAGFDAGEGDPIGGYSLTPECYARMTGMLKTLAGGKIVLSLEGGYAAKALAPSATACLKNLLGEEDPKLPYPRALTVSGRSPSRTSVGVLNSIIDIQSKYWTLTKPETYEIPVEQFKEKGKRKKGKSS